MTTQKFRGIIPPFITPIIKQEKLDIFGIERLIEHILTGGVHGLFILGTTGEGPSLSYDLRYELTERVCNQVKEKIPVLVCITDTSITESIKLGHKAADVGADAVVAAPPYYFSSSQSELIEYFRELARQSPLPLFLYNMPSHTKTKILPDTVQTLSKHPNIIGLKDSSGDLIYFQKVIHLVNDSDNFSVLVGPEEILMQAMLSGGHGGVNGGANMFPRLYVDMYNAVCERDYDLMQQLQKKILKISSSLYALGNSQMSYLQGVKCVLSIKGICSDELALPFQKFTSYEREKVIRQMEELNLY